MNNRERELRAIVNRINRLYGELTMELRNLSDMASEIVDELEKKEMNDFIDNQSYQEHSSIVYKRGTNPRWYDCFFDD